MSSSEPPKKRLETGISLSLQLKMNPPDSFCAKTKICCLSKGRYCEIANFCTKKKSFPGEDFFFVQKFAISQYLPLDKQHIFVLAQKLSGGFILSCKESDIPVSKRFFGGSEEDMRGYAYYSVSPLEGNKPAGGESALYYTLETRLRISKTLGL